MQSHSTLFHDSTSQHHPEASEKIEEIHRSTEVEAESVPYIWVLDKLPSEASEEEYQCVPITSVIPEWKALPVYSEKVKKTYDVERLNTALKEKFKDYFDNLQTIYDYFVLVDMGRFGKGLFARKDIPVGTKLLYLGFINFSSENEKNSNYRFALATGAANSTSAAQMLQSEDYLAIDGNDFANYFQHLPDTSRNGEYNFTDQITKIKTADFQPRLEAITEDFNILLIESKLPIKKGTLAGFDYSLAHWTQETPTFFSSDGKEVFDVVPYKVWNPDICNLANFFLVELTDKLDNLDREKFMSLLARKVQPLISLNTEQLDELDIISNGEVLEYLKKLLSTEQSARVFIQALINLFIPPTQILDIKKAHKLLNENSAFCYLINKVAPHVNGHLTNIRKQLFPFENAAQAFQRTLENQSQSSQHGIKWHHQQDNVQNRRFTFWAQGNIETMQALEKNLGTGIKHAYDNVKGKKDIAAITIRKTF